MRSIRPTTVAGLAALALVAAARLGSAQALPTAKELMDKHDAAIGGRATLDKHTSVHQVGKLLLAAQGIEASMEVFRAKPALFLQKLVIGPMGEVQQGFDGTNAWAMQGGQPVLLAGAQAEMAKYNSDFFGNFHDMARYSSAETVELADFEGRKCYKVKIVRKIGGEGFEFFDSETGLGAGTIVIADSPAGKVETTSIFSDYKDFDGLKYPTKITQRGAIGEVTITISTLEFDQVAAETFALPAAVKALIKP